MPPQPVAPLNGSTLYTPTPMISWNRSLAAAWYRAQISSQQNFRQILVDGNGIVDTTYSLSGLPAGSYYWRVSASNNAGTSAFSTTRSFTLSAPPPPSLVAPAVDAVGIGVPVVFRWDPAAEARTYQLQIATASNFNTNAIVRDSAGIAATTVQIAGLAANTDYYWRVRSANELGAGSFSASRKFRTASVTSVLRDSVTVPTGFMLYQNFPNPFNPSTLIRFTVYPGGNVSLVVYDLFGREVARLHEGELPTGTYEIPFSTGDLASGVYIYQLRAGEKTLIRKMLLLR
jgi:hypothetical protein